MTETDSMQALPPLTDTGPRWLIGIQAGYETGQMLAGWRPGDVFRHVDGFGEIATVCQLVPTALAGGKVAFDILALASVQGAVYISRKEFVHPLMDTTLVTGG